MRDHDLIADLLGLFLPWLGAPNPHGARRWQLRMRLRFVIRQDRAASNDGRWEREDSSTAAWRRVAVQHLLLCAVRAPAPLAQVWEAAARRARKPRYRWRYRR